MLFTSEYVALSRLSKHSTPSVHAMTEQQIVGVLRLNLARDCWVLCALCRVDELLAERCLPTLTTETSSQDSLIQPAVLMVSEGS